MSQMQPPINGPLAALIQLKQAEQMLKQGASPVVPSTGQPTVAGQAIQSAQALTQPPPQPETQAGIENILPGVQQQASMQAQQPVTQQQFAQAMQQMQQRPQAPNPPVGAARGGIISLPADVNMAEGGIVGYSGTGESLVKNLSIDEINRMSPEMRKAYFKDLMERRGVAGPISTSVGAAPVGSGSLVNALRAGLTRFAPLAFLTELFTTSDEDVALLKQAEAERGAANAVDTLKGRPRGQADYGVEELSPPQEIRDLLAKYPGQGRRGAAAATPPQKTEPVVSSTPITSSAAPAAAANAGIAQLTQPGFASYLQSALDANRSQILPDKVTAQGIDEARRAEMIRRGIDPDYYKVRERDIDALQAAYAAEAADRAKMVAERNADNYRRMLTRVGGAPTLARGLAYASQSMEPIVEKQRLSDQEFRRLMIERQKAISDSRAAVQQFREAQVLGDLKTQAESTKEYNEAINKQKTAESKLYGDVVSPLMQTESREREGALNREEAARDRRSRELIAGQQLKQQAEQNGQMQLANRINAANVTVSSALEKLERQMEKKYGLTLRMYQMLPPEERKKNQAYRDYQREYDELFRTTVEPAIAERNRLAAMVSGVGGNVQRYDSQGNPIK